MNLNKSVVAGHLVVSFDNVINGFLSVVIAPIFFGLSLDPTIQLLLSYAAFATVYVFLPFGALVFGKLGDQIGRRKILLCSILGVGVPSLLMGLLPTHEAMFTAPLILLILRAAQGFFSGSEYSGVLIYNHETGNKHPDSASNIISYGTMGGFVAAIICFFITQEGYPAWFWRIPYIVGGIAALVVFATRKKISETTEYLIALKEKSIEKSPMKKLLADYKLELMVSISVSACYIGTAYSSIIFGNRLFQQAGYTVHKSMIFSMINLLFSSFSIMIMGKVAKVLGVKNLLKYGALIFIFASFPVCLLISGELTIIKIYLYMTIVTFLSASIASCSATYISDLFKVSCRYSGFSMADSIGSIIGGITPFMLLLFSSIFKSNIGCVVWFYILTIPTFILVCIMNRTLDARSR